jgi:phenylacetate-CoA ligase
MLHTLPEIECSEKAFITAFQNQKLIETIQYVAKYSTYYQQLFNKHGIDISTITGINDLSKIPVTTKDQLAAHNSDFICVEPLKIIDYITTSGTIGDPVTLVMTDADLERLAYNEAISLAGAGCSANDIIQLTTTIDKRFMAGLAYCLGAKKLGAGMIRVGAGMPELQWDSIHRFHPTVLIAVPSFIMKLIEYAEKNYIEYRASSIKKVICIGEPIRGINFELNTLGRKITEKWSIELYSTYASTEMATAFTECSFGVGGHHHPELLIVEFLDDDNRHVAEDEPGEVTITSIGVTGMPLLRYKTGDICYHYEAPCQCGRTTMRLGPIIGRKQQMIKYKGTTLFPASIHDILNERNDIDSYLIEVSTNELGTDEICIKIALKAKEEFGITKELRDHFKAKLRVTPDIILMDRGELHAIQITPYTRKPITFIDRRIQTT